MPLHILSFSGFIPEQICDTIRFTGYQGGNTISHYCAYASDFIDQVREDPCVDGAVYPRTCDSCRVMRNYLAGCEGKFLFSFHVPPRRDRAALEFLSFEIQNYQHELEKHYQMQIRDIAERIQKIEERNANGRKLYHELSEISFFSYLNAIHKMLQSPLGSQTLPSNLPQKPGAKKRVYLVGSFLCDTGIVELIEKNGLAIVGDNLPESKRLFGESSQKIQGDLYHQIARDMLSRQLSPTQNNFKELIQNDLQEMREKTVDGVIFLTQKYCEPYDFLFSTYKKALSEQEIPVLQLSVSGSSHDRKLELAIEAFADML